jgi:hypothetical protein
MSANTAPIYSGHGDVSTNNSTGASSTALTTATGDYTGVSANNLLVYTAGTNGGYIERIRFKAIGTNVASVARIYLNNGSAHTTATNNEFYGELNLPATTATNTAGTVDLDYPMGFALPASWTVYVGIATTVAAGWIAVPIGGQY